MMKLLDLQGDWSFPMDREDCEVEREWFNRELADSIYLPGSLQEQEYGDKPSRKTERPGPDYDRLCDIYVR